MRHRTAPLVAMLASLLVAVSGCSLCHQAAFSGPGVIGSGSAAAQLRAGVGIAQVAVPGSAPLAGFGGKPRRYFTGTKLATNLLALGGTCIPHPPNAATFFESSTGTLDPIMARALVLDNGTRKIAIVKVDTIGSSRQLRDALFAVAHPLGVATVSDLVLLATHTHSGPGSISDQPLWQVIATDCYAQNAYDPLLAAATTALQNANASLQPAQLVIGTDYVNGASQNRSGHPGVFDAQLALMKVTTTTGTPIAAFFNFAVHGTSLDQSNMKFSPDCMGAMERRVESQIPGVVAIFTNAAEGDVAPVYTGSSGVTQEGLIVGDAVVALWNEPTLATGKTWVDLRTALQDVAMPTPSFHDSSSCIPLPGASTNLCAALGVSPPALPLQPQWVPTTLPFQALRIDDTVFVAIPGEPITQIGWDLKTAAIATGFTRGVILGLANDHGGYFTTYGEYLTNSYESQCTIYGPSTGSVIESSAEAVMQLVY